MKNKYKPFLILVTLFLSAGAVSAQARCPDMGQAKVNVNFQYGSITYINNRSNNEFPELPYASTMGLTVTDLKRQASADSMIQSDGKGGYCVMLEKVKVDIGFPKVDIYIDKKYRPGSCNYNVIKEHENYHARVQQEGLRFFAPKIKEAYQIAAKKIKPREAYSFENAQQVATQMVNQIEADVAPLMAYVQKRLREENEVIDTKESYQAESARCKKW